LQTLSEQAPIPSLKAASKDLLYSLNRTARGAPIYVFIARDGESVAPDDVVESMDRFLKEVERQSPKYQQPAFQCLSDFREAEAKGEPRLLAGFALAVCLARFLIPIKT